MQSFVITVDSGVVDGQHSRLTVRLLPSPTFGFLGYCKYLEQHHISGLSVGRVRLHASVQAHAPLMLRA